MTTSVIALLQSSASFNRFASSSGVAASCLYFSATAEAAFATNLAANALASMRRLLKLPAKHIRAARPARWARQGLKRCSAHLPVSLSRDAGDRLVESGTCSWPLRQGQGRRRRLLAYCDLHCGL